MHLSAQLACTSSLSASFTNNLRADATPDALGTGLPGERASEYESFGVSILRVSAAQPDFVEQPLNDTSARLADDTLSFAGLDYLTTGAEQSDSAREGST